MNLNLSKRRALVCGASQGIGEACAMELALLGCDVVCLARNEVKLKTAVQALAREGQQEHHYLVADVSKEKELMESVEADIKKYGGFHILINNSGGPPAGPALRAKAEDFTAAFKSHLLMSSQLSQMLVPFMQEEGFGRIINILSTSVKTPLPDLGVSNSIRWAVASWGKTLATEVAPYGITVNSVLPGATRTQRLLSLIEQKAKRGGTNEAEEEKRWLATIPAGRFAEAAEVAAMVAFLSSPAAGYVNGVAIAVDGGRTPCL